MSVVLSQSAKGRSITSFEECESQIKRWFDQKPGEFTQQSLEETFKGCTILILDKMERVVRTVAGEIIAKIQRQCERDLNNEKTFTPLPILQGLCSQSVALAYGGMGALTASQATSALVFLGSGLGGAGVFFALTMGGLHMLNEARPTVRRDAIRAAAREAQEKVEKERDRILTALLRYKLKLMAAENEKKERNYSVQVIRFQKQLQSAIEEANCSKLNAEVDRASHHLVGQIMANVLRREQEEIVKALSNNNCDLAAHRELITAKVNGLERENRDYLARVEQARINAEKATLMAERATTAIATLGQVHAEALARAEKSDSAAIKAHSAVAESRALLAQALARADAADATASELRNANFAIERRFETKLHDKFTSLIAALHSNEDQKPVRELFQSSLQNRDLGGPPTPEIQEIQIGDEKRSAGPLKMIETAEEDGFECIGLLHSSCGPKLLTCNSSWNPDSQDLAANTLLELSERE